MPILIDSMITNTGFRDVDYHSGEPYDPTDWAVDVNTASERVIWSSVDYPAEPENANALRWSTMYNFSFDADSPPQDALATIGLFKTGGPSSVAVYVQAPATNLIPLFADDFETGDTTGWSSVTP